jgi:hypothetical protein
VAREGCVIQSLTESDCWGGKCKSRWYLTLITQTVVKGPGAQRWRVEIFFESHLEPQFKRKFLVCA